MANDPRSKFEKHEAAKVDPAWEASTPETAGKRFDRVVHQRQREQAASNPPAKPPQTVADDTKNRFQRHDENVAAQRRNTSARDERIAKSEQDREKWQRQSTGGLSPTVASDPELQELRRKAREDAAQRKQIKAISINPDMLRAAILLWRAEWPNGQRFIPVDFNVHSFNNLLMTLIAKGEEVNPELCESAYCYAIQENYLYTKQPTERTQADGSVVRKRGAVLHDTPPKMYPAYKWPDEIANDQETELKAALERSEAERQRALGMDFNELKRQVRAGYRTPDESAAGTGSVR